MVKAYKLEVFILDYNDMGYVEDSILNSCEDCHVEINKIESREVPNWDDNHALNQNKNWEETFIELFK